MDVAGTFFANFMTILIALLDKSVSLHFTKNLDLDELVFFELTTVVCHHRHVLTYDRKHKVGPRLLAEIKALSDLTIFLKLTEFTIKNAFFSRNKTNVALANSKNSSKRNISAEKRILYCKLS